MTADRYGDDKWRRWRTREPKSGPLILGRIVACRLIERYIASIGVDIVCAAVEGKVVARWVIYPRAW